MSRLPQQPAFILNWRNKITDEHIARDTPFDWPALFGNSNPIDLEIGIGNGSFLVPFAHDYRNRNIVGIEIEGQYVRRADKRLTREGLTNSRLLIGDAKLYAWKLFADESISDLYLNFPDPWFKKRHLKRRIVSPITLKMFTIKIQNVLTIVTDDEEYRDWVIECVDSVACLEKVFPSYFVNELDGYYPTKYEKKWRAHGKAIFYMKFRKTGLPDIDVEEYRHSQNLDFALNKIYKTAQAAPRVV